MLTRLPEKYKSFSDTFNVNLPVKSLFQLTKKQISANKILFLCKLFASMMVFLFISSLAQSATITSTAAGGTWTTGSTWIGGVVPANGDAVVIATLGTGAVQITGNITQSAAGSVTVNNGGRLIVSANRVSITLGSFTISNGGTATINRNLTVLGTTTIAGTISFGSTNTTARSMSFTGAVTINTGGVWNETTTGAAATITFRGGVTNNGTFTAQAPIHTFITNAQTLNGDFSIPNVTVTGIALTNNGTLAVSAALTGTGTLINSATGILKLGGAVTIAAINTIAAGNTVNYTGAGQTAKVTTYHNLILSSSGTKTFATTPTVNGTLSLEGTASIMVTTGVVTYGTAATLQYNKPTAYAATTEEWITPFASTGGVIVTNTGAITAPVGRTIAGGSSLNLQNGTLIAGTNISMATTSTINRIEGSMTGAPQGTGIYNVNYTGNSKTAGSELTGSGLYNVTVNLATITTALTSSATAFTVGNNLTITQGNIILAATNADYTIANDLIVSGNGTLTHSVDWNSTYKLLRVNGNIAIDGKFAYTVRSHVQMGGINKTIRTGPAPSALSILTLAHSSGTISASGLVTVDDNFWASFIVTGGTFATSTYTVIAKSALLNDGGTININGGTLNVTGGLHVGYQDLNGTVVVSSGTLNSDFLSIGDGTRTGTFSQTGGTTNITGSLQINPACSYICTNSPVINIGGNFVNNGTYTKANEALVFSGTTPASLSGSSNTDIYNLSISNTGGLTTQLDLLTTNNLTITSGKFTIEPQKYVTVNGALTLNDSIILKSTSAGTASLMTKGSVTGSKARVERYINGISWAWHFLSSPVAAQPISSGFTPTPATSYDFYTWYEPQLTWVNFKNTATAPTWNTANGNMNFIPGKGYLVAYESTNTTKNFKGALNNGAVNFSLTRNGTSTYQYFNLIGNPYPCSINWDAASGWDRSNLNGTQKSFWIWNDAAGNYGAYITGSFGFGTNGVTNNIPSGQGFMVLAQSTGNLTMDNAVKVNSTQAYLKGEEFSAEELRLKLSCDANAYSDEAIVSFNNSAPADGSQKLNSMYTDAPELWSVKGGSMYSINFLSDMSSVVPLTVKAGVAGIYTLTASQVESFAGNSVISLEDRLVGTFTMLSANPSNSFQVSEPSTISDRFFLHFIDVTGSPNIETTPGFSMYSVDGIIKIQSLQQMGGKIAIIDMQGRTIAAGRIEAGAATQINMNGKTGVYVVSILTGKRMINTKVFVK